MIAHGLYSYCRNDGDFSCVLEKKKRNGEKEIAREKTAARRAAAVIPVVLYAQRVRVKVAVDNNIILCIIQYMIWSTIDVQFVLAAQVNNINRRTSTAIIGRFSAQLIVRA